MEKVKSMLAAGLDVMMQMEHMGGGMQTIKMPSGYNGGSHSPLLAIHRRIKKDEANARLREMRGRYHCRTFGFPDPAKKKKKKNA